MLLIAHSHRDALVGYCFGMVKDWSAAEDIVHEAFLTVSSKWENYRSPDEVFPWVRGIVRRKALAHFRSRNREESMEEAALESLFHGQLESEILADPNSYREELARRIGALRECMAGLTPRAKRLLHEFYAEMKSCRQIADEQNEAPDTPKVQLYRLRNRLRECMRNRLAGTGEAPAPPASDPDVLTDFFRGQGRGDRPEITRSAFCGSAGRPSPVREAILEWAAFVSATRQHLAVADGEAALEQLRADIVPFPQPQPAVAPAARPPRHRLWTALAACAAVAMAAIALPRILPPTPGTVPQVVALSGDVSVLRTGENQGRPAVGQDVRPGERIETGDGGRIVLRYPGEATTLVVGASSSLRLLDGGDRKALALRHGTLTCTVARQPRDRSMRLVTPHAKATVLGTHFILEAAESRTSLAVEEGRVRFADGWGDRSTDVVAGYYATVTGRYTNEPGYLSTPAPITGRNHAAPLAAFPGASGGGAAAIGGRGGEVIEVTTLADAGPGSLREACETPGPRTIVFRTGGTIRLASAIEITEPYLTIAGQTAPGGGIAIDASVPEYGGLRIMTHDVVVRYLRVRGRLLGTDRQKGIKIRSGARDVVVDHCSISGFCGGNITIRDRGIGEWPVGQVTVSQTLAFGSATPEAIRRNHAADLRTAFGDDEHPNQITFARNVFAHNDTYMLSLATDTAEVVNNVFVGSKSPPVELIGGTAAGIVGNVFWAIGGPSGFPEIAWSPGFANRPGRPADPGIFIEDNRRVLAGALSKPLGWGEVTGRSLRDLLGAPAAEAGSDWRRLDPAFSRPARPLAFQFPTPAAAASTLLETSLAAVGARHRLLPDGTFVDNRDDLDRDILEHIAQGATPQPGIPPAIAPLDPGIPYPDEDHDGMSDDWERQHGYSTSDPTDRNSDHDSDRFTALEEFLNGTDPGRAN